MEQDEEKKYDEGDPISAEDKLKTALQESATVPYQEQYSEQALELELNSYSNKKRKSCSKAVSNYNSNSRNINREISLVSSSGNGFFPLWGSLP
jgi:hypothetical protein